MSFYSFELNVYSQMSHSRDAPSILMLDEVRVKLEALRLPPLQLWWWGFSSPLAETNVPFGQGGSIGFILGRKAQESPDGTAGMMLGTFMASAGKPVWNISTKTVSCCWFLASFEAVRKWAGGVTVRLRPGPKCICNIYILLVLETSRFVPTWRISKTDFMLIKVSQHQIAGDGSSCSNVLLRRHSGSRYVGLQQRGAKVPQKLVLLPLNRTVGENNAALFLDLNTQTSCSLCELPAPRFGDILLHLRSYFYS